VVAPKLICQPGSPTLKKGLSYQGEGRSNSRVSKSLEDLFVNFHDTRAAAGFTALGELACRTQVIYFTHHQHLTEIAQVTLGDAVTVARLA
jgi:uncharacterized protein YhaN